MAHIHLYVYIKMDMVMFIVQLMRAKGEFLAIKNNFEKLKNSEKNKEQVCSIFCMTAFKYF